jgi:hypothetical protein
MKIVTLTGQVEIRVSVDGKICDLITLEGKKFELESGIKL